jgi:hypothetical protein
MDWIYLAQDRGKWRTVIETEKNRQVPEKQGQFIDYPRTNNLQAVGCWMKVWSYIRKQYQKVFHLCFAISAARFVMSDLTILPAE